MEGSGTGTGTRVSPRLTSLLFLLSEERYLQPRAVNKYWAGGLRSCDHAAYKFQQFLVELVDGASLQFFDRVVVLAVLLQRQVVDIPVMAQLQDLLVCLPLR